MEVSKRTQWQTVINTNSHADQVSDYTIHRGLFVLSFLAKDSYISFPELVVAVFAHCAYLSFEWLPPDITLNHLIFSIGIYANFNME